MIVESTTIEFFPQIEIKTIEEFLGNAFIFLLQEKIDVFAKTVRAEPHTFPAKEADSPAINRTAHDFLSKPSIVFANHHPELPRQAIRADRMRDNLITINTTMEWCLHLTDPPQKESREAG